MHKKIEFVSIKNKEKCDFSSIINHETYFSESSFNILFGNARHEIQNNKKRSRPACGWCTMIERRRAEAFSWNERKLWQLNRILQQSSSGDCLGHRVAYYHDQPMPNISSDEVWQMAVQWTLSVSTEHFAALVLSSIINSSGSFTLCIENMFW